MFRWLVTIPVLSLLILSVVLLVQNDPGYLLLKYAGFSIETNLALAIVTIICVVALIHLAWKILHSVWRLPDMVKRQSQNSRFEKSRRLLNQGLIDLIEGRFRQAEINLIKLVEHSENPLLHYLVAARAAQMQGKYEQRDTYLKAAHEARPDAEIAIGVTQAELQLAHRQTEQALATLLHLNNIAPRHDHIAVLLAKVYYQLKDWQPLLELLPNAHKKKIIPNQRLKKMEADARKGILSSLAASGDVKALQQAWHKTPKSQQIDTDLLLHYVTLMHEITGQISDVEAVLVKSLDQHWDDRLVEIYGRSDTGNVSRQLKQAEAWLTHDNQNENLLLALGRICMRARLWGKAQGYLEAASSIRPTPACYLALAELCSLHLQDTEKAAEYYQQGLELSLAGDYQPEPIQLID